MNIEVANRLAELRKRHGLSQEQLAEQLGISRQAVSKWERAESSPDTDNLIALAKLYQVSLDELVKMDPDSEDDELFAQSVERVREAERAQAAQMDRVDVDEEPLWKLPRRKSGGINWYAMPYPVIVVIVYLLIGFYLDMWHPGWMLFMTVPMYYTAIEGDHFNLNRIPYPLMVATIYLIIGFAWDWWHPGWMIFLTIPLYYTMMGKRIKSGLNMILIALMVLGVFALLGASFGSWTRWLLSGAGVVLCALGVIQAIRD